MKSIKRVFLWCGIGLAGLLIVLLLGRNLLIQHGAAAAVKAALGLDLSIGEVQTGLLDTDFRIKDLVVRNPPGFGKEPLAKVPLIYVDYELGSLLSGKLHCTKVEVEVEEVSAVENAKGETNLQKIQSLAGGDGKKPGAKKPEGGKPTEMRIDKLVLTVGRVRHIRLREDGSVRDEKEFKIGLDHEVFENLDGPGQIVRLVVWRALKAAGLSALGGLALDSLETGLKNVSGKGLEALQGLGDTLKDGAKGLFDKVKKGVGGD